MNVQSQPRPGFTLTTPLPFRPPPPSSSLYGPFTKLSPEFQGVIAASWNNGKALRGVTSLFKAMLRVLMEDHYPQATVANLIDVIALLSQRASQLP